MKAVLEIGDMTVFGRAKLYGLTINFTGSHFMPKRKTKMHPTDLAIKRFERGVVTRLRLVEDGVIYTKNLLSYGLTINTLSQCFLNASFRLEELKK